MSYFDCAYFDQTYFSTDCAPTGGKVARGGPIRRIPRPSEPPVLDDGDELLALF